MSDFDDFRDYVQDYLAMTPDEERGGCAPLMLTFAVAAILLLLLSSLHVWP